MSATGRNLEGNERHEGDFYETPEWCTRAIVPVLRDEIPSPLLIVDAGAGSGAIARVMRQEFPGAQVTEIEKEPSRAQGYALDYLDRDSVARLYNLPRHITISNPPYVNAMEFVQEALYHLGLVCFLLRLNWLGSQDRAAFHRANPADVYILPRRPSFVPWVINKRGKKVLDPTDATEYAWFVWGSRRGGGHWSVLECEEKPRRKRGQ